MKVEEVVVCNGQKENGSEIQEIYSWPERNTAVFLYSCKVFTGRAGTIFYALEIVFKKEIKDFTKTESCSLYSFMLKSRTKSIRKT